MAVDTTYLTFSGQLIGRLAAGLEVIARFDELCAERAYGGVLLHAVAMRHDDVDSDTVTTRRPCNRLAMIAARRRYHTTHLRLTLAQGMQISQPAAHLERAHFRVVLMLHAHRRAHGLREHRPAVLRGRWNHRMNDAGRSAQMAQFSGTVQRCGGSYGRHDHSPADNLKR